MQSLHVDTTTEVNKTSEDFYSKLSSIDHNTSTTVPGNAGLLDLSGSNLPKFGGGGIPNSENRVIEKASTGEIISPKTATNEHDKNYNSRNNAEVNNSDQEAV